MSDNRRNFDRIYVPAKVTHATSSGRVLDASNSGLLIELQSNTKPDSKELILSGRTGIARVRILEAWERSVGANRLRMGIKTQDSLRDWISKEVQAYDDLDAIKHDLVVTQEDLKRISRYEIENASKAERSLIEMYETVGERPQTAPQIESTST